MKRLVALMVLGALPACNVTTAAPPPTVEPVQSRGLWQVQLQTDKASGAQKMVAKLMSVTARQDSRRRSMIAGLLIACASGRPYFAILFDGPVSTRKTAEFGYRIDNNPGKNLMVDALSAGKSVAVTNEQQVAEFLRELGPSSGLYVWIHSRRLGLSTAEFSTAGAAAALDATLRECRPGQRKS
jgi:hypothetical protein